MHNRSANPYHHLCRNLAGTTLRILFKSYADTISFLDENTRNTDLIRWSDSGDSFIVIDEDEFAKTLIPELFKHNNYASFVRQLNMYGFHKKVGLSDNSMRASERKNKNPSEYSNPYFKRGKPNLLWLIHKPKNAPSKGAAKNNAKSKQEDVEEEAEDFFPRDSPAPPARERLEDTQNPWNTPRLALPAAADGKLPPEQFRNLQQEMAEIRRQQNRITEMLSMTRRENAQLYSQAKAFHELHEKHDNSINAILTFLATVYNKNMNDKGLDFRNMFGPNSLPAKADGHDVIDVEEEKQRNAKNAAQQTYRKKRPLLLKDKASPVPSVDSPNQINQWPSDTFGPAGRPKSSPFHSPAIEEIHELTPSNRSSQSPQNDHDNDFDQAVPDSEEAVVPHRDILSVIQNQNAQNHNLNGTQMEFPEALSRLQNTDGQSPLTPSQRQNMLRLMSDEQANTLQNANPNNALTSYSPPNPAVNLAHFNMNSEQLNQIEQSLREQEARMANMQATIAPLSPSGSIPGVTDTSYNNNSSELDLDSIFNSGDYFNDGTDPNNFDFTNVSGADFPDFDFSTAAAMDSVGGAGDPGGQGQGLPPGQFDGIMDEGRVKEMDSSEATSPANTVNTIDDEAAQQQQQVEQSSPRKLRRKG